MDQNPVLVFDDPPSADGSRRRLIASVHYNGSIPYISLEPTMKNRVVGWKQEDFIHISFQGLKFETENKERYKQHLKDVLTNGVQLQGRLFLFCGHSNSQLRSRSCFLYAAENHEAVAEMINRFGDFGNIKDVAKRSKRIGLLFSNADQIMYLSGEETRETTDVVRNGHIFTDGCGFISEKFAREVTKKSLNRKGNMGCSNDYVPKVYQIRYKGYKGILMVEKEEKMKKMIQESLFQRILSWMLLVFSKTFWQDFRSNFVYSDRELKVLFRHSMRKFSKCTSDELYILEHSKPTSSAKLNAELVSLLSSLGVPDEIFERKLIEYFDFVENASKTKQGAIGFLEYKGRYKMMEKVKACPYFDALPNWLHTQIRISQCDELKTSFDKNELERVHIMVPKSRLLYGVCDNSGQLKVGQVMVKYTTNWKTLATETLEGQIIVGRNPSLHPGDIQTFTAVDIPEMDYLVDCIIFSTEGKLPPASQMSGGDLDGDKFFICWDDDLIPPKCHTPLDYSSIQSNCNIEFKCEHPQLDLINYFAHFNNNTLGRLTALYSEWIRANKSGRAFSEECLMINKLYSKCVDGEIVEIPDKLRQPPKPDPDNIFVLDKLIARMKEMLELRFSNFLTMFENRKLEKASKVEEE